MGNIFRTQSFDIILRVIILGFMKENEAAVLPDI
jgi:hypothetical protein